MPSIWGYRGKRSRGGRKSHEKWGKWGRKYTRGGRGGKRGREVQEEIALAIPTTNNLPSDNNNDLNLAVGDLNGKNPKAERPKKRPHNRNITFQKRLVLI